MTFAARLTTLVAFIAACAWAFSTPGYDSIAACLAALGAFVGSFFLKQEEGKATQSQTVQGGCGIQAGRDVTIKDRK